VKGSSGPSGAQGGPGRAQGSPSPRGGAPHDHRSPAALGRPRLHLRRTDSTNYRARELATAGVPHGTLVTASAQTAGRGRQGRRWLAPAHSSLLMSLVLRSPPPLLPLIAAVAICDMAGDEAMIKWPNDIVLVRAPASSAPSTFAKLAGILTEGRPQQGWAVLGIGLNVAVRLDELPPELRATAATLGESPDAIEPILARLLSALERRLNGPISEILDAWRARDALRGRTIAWNVHGPDDRRRRGQADGIDGAGRLIVALPGGGRTTLEAGEVHLAIG
jgi:BirA family biotin operon repressor/biotin-[acetyl-CoA-carboxylase] ligase